MSSHARPLARPAALVGAAVLGALLLGACAEEEKGIPHPVDRLHYPTTLAADPNGRFLYVVSSNFDVRYRTGAVIAIDLATYELLPETAIGIGNFGGELTLRAIPADDFGDEEAAYRLVGYVPSRSSRALYWFTVADDDDGSPVLDCGEDPGAREDGEVSECQDEHTIRSAERRRLPRDDAGLAPEDIADADPTVDMSLALDVYGTAIFPGAEGVSDYLLVTNPRTGVISFFHVDGGYPLRPGDPGQPWLGEDDGADDDFVPSAPGEPVFLEQYGDLGGVFAVAVTPQGERAYATTRFASAVLPFRLTEIPDPDLDPDGPQRMWPVLTDLVTVLIPTVGAGTDFGRQLVFDESGTRAYLAYHNPSSVVLLDTTPGEDGVRTNRLVGVVEVGLQPSALALAPTGPAGADRLYVVCFRDETVWVLDPDTLEVEDRIELPGGPFDLVIVPDPTNGALRAYVTMFELDAVAVIDLDPASPFFHQPIAYIRGVDDEGAHP